MPWLEFVGDDEFTWDGRCGRIDPQLPIHDVLAEGHVVAGMILNGLHAQVAGGFYMLEQWPLDLTVEQITERDGDPVPGDGRIEQLVEGRGGLG